MTMEINNPEVMAEVTRAFYEYEHALTTNDLDTIDKLFWKSHFYVAIWAQWYAARTRGHFRVPTRAQHQRH